MKKLLVVVALFAMTFFICPAAFVEPISDLTDAVIYWQELALQLKTENEQIKAENKELKTENQLLKEDLAAADTLIIELKDNVSEIAQTAREAEKLRIQADQDLKEALSQIKILEAAIKKLTGPRFSALIGATYESGTYGLMAGITIGL